MGGGRNPKLRCGCRGSQPGAGAGRPLAAPANGAAVPAHPWHALAAPGAPLVPPGCAHAAREPRAPQRARTRNPGVGGRAWGAGRGDQAAWCGTAARGVLCTCSRRQKKRWPRPAAIGDGPSVLWLRGSEGACWAGGGVHSGSARPPVRAPGPVGGAAAVVGAQARRRPRRPNTFAPASKKKCWLAGQPHPLRVAQCACGHPVAMLGTHTSDSRAQQRAGNQPAGRGLTQPAWLLPPPPPLGDAPSRHQSAPDMPARMLWPPASACWDPGHPSR